MPILINNLYGSRISSSFIKKDCQKVFGKTKKKLSAWQISIALVGSQESKKINQKYRNKNKPATVLSFVYPKKSGEIILAIPEIKKRSKAEKRNFADVFSHLLIHGLLHILGYCHDSRQSARKMEELEKSLVKDL